MTDPHCDFRLNFEQQKKRAKELLRAAKSGDAVALQRCHAQAGDSLTLAKAQHALARELRFANWTALKQHIAAMEQQRSRIEHGDTALDADLRTMHIRCGHDIEHELRNAGLHGDFNVQIDPYVQGPVTNDNDWLQQRARFICEAFGNSRDFVYNDILQGCRDEEQRLQHAIDDYQRVVLWFELDAHDQLILLRCLAYFAEHGLPQRLELVSVGDFPGAQRFLGLGQLPPEALRLLWERRRRLDHRHVQLAQQVWQAYRAGNPQRLAQFLHEDTSLLPELHTALHRQLRELPSLHTGLGATQEILLATLARFDNIKVARMIGETFVARDAWSGIGDSGLDYELRQMEQAREPVFIREHLGSMREDTIVITELGRQVLAGSVNWLSLQPPPRWIGGVCIAPGQPNWHWDERVRNVVVR